jgi:Peptidase family M28
MRSDPNGPPRLQGLVPLASVAFVLVVSGITLWSHVPPRPLPADSPAEVFSAERAIRHVEAIALEPHPLGSPEAAKVRDYVVGELEALGLKPEIQEPKGASNAAPETHPHRQGSRRDVRNIVARWRGTGPPEPKALLLSAHYDSVAEGPGAGDDAAGVAAILEGLRALKARGPLVRDVIVLISDGEEAGLHGAAVFADEHPWAKDVGVALNFDARGNAGPVYMSETSEQNGWLIEQFARAVPHPIATSFSESVGRLMPNNSDLTLYKRRGMPGLNFACIGGLSYYHSWEDTPANLDRRTLQHYGESLVALAGHLGRVDLDNVQRRDVVYFSVLSRLVVFYSMAWVVPLFAVAALSFVVVVAIGMVRRRVRLGELLAGLAISGLAIVAGVMAVGIVWVVVRDIFGNLGLYNWLMHYDIELLTVFATVALVAAGALVAAASRRWSWDGLGLGALSWLLAITAATSLLLPAASYAFVWPVLGILAGQAVSFALPRGRAVAVLAGTLGAVPLLVLDLTLLPAVFDSLNLRLAALLMVPVVLVELALVPWAGQLIATMERE